MFEHLYFGFKVNLIKLKKGDVLFRENSSPDKIYLIESGDFKLLKKVQITIMPVKMVELALLSSGCLLGETGSILGQPNPYSAVCASTKAAVYAISK